MEEPQGVPQLVKRDIIQIVTSQTRAQANDGPGVDETYLGEIIALDRIPAGRPPAVDHPRTRARAGEPLPTHRCVPGGSSLADDGSVN